MRARVVVSGRVQGVWFRDSCRHEADRLGLAGWVRNNRDGTVEAVFEGSEEAVGEMVGWCRVGSPRAVVEGVDVGFEEPRGEPGFRIH